MGRSGLRGAVPTVTAARLQRTIGEYRLGAHPAEEFIRTLESFGNVVADILPAQVFLELRSSHQLGGLLRRATQNKAAAGGVHSICEMFKRLDTGRVDHGHVAQAQ